MKGFAECRRLVAFVLVLGSVACVGSENTSGNAGTDGGPSSDSTTGSNQQETGSQDVSAGGMPDAGPDGLVGAQTDSSMGAGDAALEASTDAALEGSTEAGADAPSGPACGTGQGCAPMAPSGWTGPVAFYNGSAGAPACPTGSSVAFSGGTGLSAPIATCSACKCDDPTGISCSDPVLTSWGSCGSSSGGGVGQEGTAPTPSTCTMGFSCGGESGPLEVPITFGGSTASGGSCTASGGTATKPPVSWTTNAEACKPSGSPSACGTGNLCIPEASDFSACVYQAGDVSCPADTYTSKQVIETLGADSRACTSCECAGSPPATCAGGVVTLSDQANCADDGHNVTVAVPSTTCPAFTCNGGSIYFQLSTAPTPTCTAPSGGQATGSVTTNEITVCCM